MYNFAVTENNTLARFILTGRTIILLVILGLAMASCYGPIETTKYVPPGIKSAMSPDSGVVNEVSNEEVIYEKYASGQYKSRKKITYKSKRKTLVEEHRYHKVDVLIMFTGLPKEEPADSAQLAEDSLAALADTLDPVVPPIDSTVIDTLPADTVEKDPILSLFTDTVVEAEIFDKQFRTDENIYTQRRKLTSYYDGGSIVKEKTKMRSKFRDGCEILVMKRTKIYDDEENLVYKEVFCWLMWRQVRYFYDGDGKRVQKRVVKCMFKPKFRNYP